MGNGNSSRRSSEVGFTPLAQRLNQWRAGSPRVTETANAHKSEYTQEDSQVFPDEHSIQEAASDTETFSEVPEIKEPVLEDITLTDEDLALMSEANEMSGMSPEHIESMLSVESNDDTISETSQEYGDENIIPPTSDTLVLPVTPQRPLRREFHTVSKIPLKDFEESTPIARPSPEQQRHSASRLPVPRPTFSLSRSATVISYSPTKNKEEDETTFEEAIEGEILLERSGSVPPPETPSRPSPRDQTETPARTPRRDVNPTMLQEAAVFVDVYTMDGADASALFVELLTQMGARCVSKWDWEPREDDASSKIGITHVVYKDGGKRTLEKVRKAAGAVHCVGVGWVLDCERENKWLEETPYYIDDLVVPRRRSSRRRKTTEPKAPDSKTRNTKRECRTAPTTPLPNRRDSCLWMHTPEDPEWANEDGMDDFDFEDAGHEAWYSTAPLTPVPKTPAPDTIRRFAMEIQPDTPSAVDDEDHEACDSNRTLSREQLVQRSCPPKPQHMYDDMGAGILGLSKDETVARRLQDARRKSMAFAPRVSSPLAKSWKEWS
ncbi:hypothetical protein BD289DRAFT_374129 [Coniella lustricola]|uniref:BRCT domain-containing protein n=1 Tax=Coniella lustricola TaxID=2025994 RepID=A0A2T3A024_9PEZI|nr:hypothetical protein BD289DRAFT_374129 [Coniella lustricola]